MHLLQAAPGALNDGQEAVDLRQDPADIIVISAADTELASLSEAFAGGDGRDFTLRLANLTHLTHPMSVDLYLDQTALKSRLVIARILGGASYWTYGLEQFAARLAVHGVAFAALPGDDKPDEALLRVSTINEADWHQLWSYLIEGGIANAGHFLDCANAVLSDDERPPPAKPLLRAGMYWPGEGVTDIEALRSHWHEGAGIVAVTFYRALLQGAGLHPINRLIAQLSRARLNPLPIFTSSLKDPLAAATIAQLFQDNPPDVVLNATSFAVSNPGQEHMGTVLDATGGPVMQMVLAGTGEAVWEEGKNGLSARDIAMNVALPEIDGRILTRAVSFKGEAFFDEATQCRIAAYRGRGDRIAFVADLAKNYVRLAKKANADKNIALILANYPNKDGRLANGVGLDTPASIIEILNALRSQGYDTGNAPQSAAELMEIVQQGPTNWLTDRFERRGGAALALADYQTFYDALPWAVRTQIEERWGQPADDPFIEDGAFRLAIHQFGNITIGLQPARGYNIDPTETYHSPDLVPPHNYIAFYACLRQSIGADAMVHTGKHGNLEWLPGKSLALSAECLPEAIFGPTPHFYPFIINDPGEGTQAKRRTHATIIDHLTPPITRAETYGPLRDLEALVDEYYEAAGVDPRRLDYLRGEILSLSATTRLDEDAGIQSGDDHDEALAKIDNYLCELKESQIRDGLHVFGQSPKGRLARDLAIALTRLPRGDGKGANASLIRALAKDLGLDFDPLDCTLGDPWKGAKPGEMNVTTDPWRTHGDAVERLEILAAELLDGRPCPGNWLQTRAVVEEIETSVRPMLERCGDAELNGLMTGLAGKFVKPGGSGAPTRGRLDILPTGRNFYSVDTRTVPTPAAWHLGWKSAELLIERHLQDHGDWPSAMALSAWGTSNMRTGGDDIAQALALIGVRPAWDQASRRVTGFEVLPSSILDRPRVDVTLRISGFFRDAFPGLIDLFSSAVKAVMLLDEPASTNPLAARYRQDLEKTGNPEHAAVRIFGSKPGAYGAGLQAMIDEKLWRDKADLADAYLAWGSYAYGQNMQGEANKELFEQRLSHVEAVIHNQDNREHDILDSDDYYQFEGGLAATIEEIKGTAPTIYHNDHSRPERPLIRTLDEEIGRVVRSRVVNPKWLGGVKRHGYKGAFEIAATVDYLFAFAATTHAVKAHHFDLVFDAIIADDDTRAFIQDNNPRALQEIAERFDEAIQRQMWTPKSNSAHNLIAAIREQK